MKKTAKEVSNPVKDIDTEIAKYQAKIHKLTAKKERISRKVIDSNTDNIPESIQTIVGQLCIRYNISWLLVINDTMDCFEVIGYDTHEDTYTFDEAGIIREHSLNGDYTFTLTDEDITTPFPIYFAVKFRPIDGQDFGMSSVKIDVNTGKTTVNDLF